MYSNQTFQRGGKVIASCLTAYMLISLEDSHCRHTPLNSGIKDGPHCQMNTFSDYLFTLAEVLTLNLLALARIFRNVSTCRVDVTTKLDGHIGLKLHWLQKCALVVVQVAYLATVGGVAIKDTTLRIMSSLIHDSLAVQCNWQGRSNKKTGMSKLTKTLSVVAG